MSELDATMTLRDFRETVKGKLLFVWISWSPDEDSAYVQVDANAFLRGIDADDRPNDTEINATCNAAHPERGVFVN